MDVFATAVTEVITGQFRLVEVAGEPGIGKTRLLAEFARLANERGLRVLSGQAVESERHQPFAALLDALDDSRDAPDQPRARLEDLLNVKGGRPATDGAVVCRRVRGFVEELAGADPRRTGVALLLDDMHMANDATIRLVAELVRRPPQAPVLLVVAYRQRQAPVRLYAAITDASAGNAVCRIALGGLTTSDVEVLLGCRRGWSVAHALHRTSGGNPFYLDALTRTWLGTSASNVDELSPAARIGLIREVQEISGAARQIIDAAAVVGETFEPAIVAELAGRDTMDVLSTLDELAALDLVRPVADGRQFVFRHTLFHQAVYATTNPGWRLAMHTRAIDSLRRRGAGPLAVARHVDQAAVPGDLDAVAMLQKAAAAAQGAPLTAVHWLRAAIRLLPNLAEHNRRRVILLAHLAQALGLAGRLQGSRDTMHEALRLMPESAAVPRARAVAFCVMIERLLCRRAEAEALLRAELDNVTTSNTIVRAILLPELACGDFAAGRLTDCVRTCQAALEAAAHHPRRMRATRAGALALMAVANAAQADTSIAREQLDEAANAVDSMLDSEFTRSLAAALWVIWGEVLLERWGDAQRHLDRAILFARRNNQTLALPHLYVKQLLVMRAQGRLGEAKRVAEDAVALAQTCGGGEQLTSALTMQCWISVLCGDIEEGVRSGAAATDRLRPSSSDWSSLLANRMLAEARLAAGDAEGCLELAAVAGGPDLPRAEICSRAAWYEIFTRAELALGRVDQATAWAERARSVAAKVNLSGRTGLALLARAHVLAVHLPAQAVEVAADAAAALEKAGVVFDATRARFVAAASMAAAGHVDKAYAELRAVQASFEGFGGHGLARQAAVERRRLAARGSRRGQSSESVGLAALTRREQQVAALVSTGLTNRRIGRELFVTEKTIEMHMANIFVKLGVSSRVAVARLIDGHRG